MKVNSTIYPILLAGLMLPLLFSCKKEVLPTVTITTVTNITDNSAKSGGEIITDGGASVTARGVCWSTNQNPTTADSKTTNGTGTGSFTSSITGLTPGATYNLKAYAINAVGTAYSSPTSFSTLALAPVLTTTDVSAVTSSSVNSGGNITNESGSPVTARGVCWSTSQNPTVADSKTTDGSGLGIFTSTITGLTPGTTYYIRAYATNSIGTSYGNQVTATTIAILPTITTTAISVITAMTAMSGGNITNDGGAVVTSSGVCWSTNQNPTIADKKIISTGNTKQFESFISVLIPRTTYYVRAFAINIIGTGYGNIVSFTSLNEETLRDALQAFPGVKGEIVTASLNGITVKCEKINGLIIYQGDIILGSQTKAASIELQDHMWTDNKVYYTINDNFPEKGRITDAFKEFENNTNITFQLRTNEPNYVEFNYIKDAGCYSNIGMIGGKQLIVIDNWGKPADIAHEIGHAIGLLHEQSKSSRDQYITINFQNIQEGEAHNFELYANSLNTPDFDFNSLMLYSSYAFSIEYGVKPTITKKDGSINGSIFTPQRDHFTETDLSLINKLYPSYPTITTSAVSSITTTSAICGGNITSDGGSPVTQRGVYWGTSRTNPYNTKTTEGTGTGSFTSSLTGLSPNTTYYVKAYATNSVGTAYADWISFTTSTQFLLPTVTTIAVSSVTTTSATSGGNVSSDGGATVTARGVCWSTSQTPTTANDKTSNGTGVGSFTSNITGLTANTTYYVRAYATNSAGTAYGSQITFITQLISGGTVSDVDGNSYSTVTIGTQEWMAENLKTTKYKDGTAIPNVTNSTTWGGLTTGAYCWYNNAATSYGALYNWFTVNTGKLCPTGWHVPSDAEWTSLTTYLGGENVAGGKLKETGTTHWLSPNTGATNERGFTALPGGWRFSGTFYDIGDYGFWWSSTETDAVSAWGRTMGSFHSGVTSYNYSKHSGFSVRCLRD